jgi:hypothetical protein
VLLAPRVVAALTIASIIAMFVVIFLATRRIMRFSLAYHDRLFNGPILFGRPLPYNFRPLFVEPIPQGLELPVVFFRVYFGVLTIIFIGGTTWVVVELVLGLF